MAKDQDRQVHKDPTDRPRAADYTADDVARLLQDLETTQGLVAEQAKELKRLVPIVAELQTMVSALTPSQSQVPVEVAQGVRPEAIWSAALQGCLIGLIQVSGPVSKGGEARWASLAATAVLMAEETFKQAVARYGKK